MRKCTFAVAVFAGSLGLLSLAQGQQPGGGRFGGGAGGGRMDALQLLQNASVKKELDLTESQVEKLPDAILKALGEVLSADQYRRLKQIEMQQRGTQAFTDAKVQDELKLSEEQRANIKTISEDSRKEAGELFKGLGKGGDFKGMQEKLDAFRKETQTKIQGVLTADQKKAWREMTGEPFKLERTFGGGAFGQPGQGGFNKKRGTDPKKDVE